MKLVGGKEASRGFLYQGFASVLEALTDKNKWDKIYIEFPTSNDKVDIALGAANKVIKSIQVKSTINTFSKSDIMVWLHDLIADIDTPEYELCLIGQCEKSAITFINSIEKFYNNTLDNTAVKSLDGFSTDLLRNKRINFIILPFEIEVLEKIVRDSLHKYISYSNQMLSFNQISFIASATVNDQMISSTHGDGIDRKKFDEELEKRIFLIADKYSPKRISIAVTSFPRGAVHLEDKTMCLSLVDKFDGRNLKSGYDWNNDIYPLLRDFLISNTKNEHAYQVFLDAHASLAFAAGYVLDSKSGINVFPIQKTAMNGTKLWDVKLSSKKSYSNWSISHEEFEKNQWTVEKNINCNTHYVNVVKALKWWRKTQYPDMKHPKSYPLEHFIGDCCPDGITSVAEGVVLTLENMVSQYPTKPFLADRGVPEHDVFARITDDEYSDFYDKVCEAAKTAREAFDCDELYDSVCKWRKLFGNEFPSAPEPSKNNSSAGFTHRTEKSSAIPEGRFA